MVTKDGNIKYEQIGSGNNLLIMIHAFPVNRHLFDKVKDHMVPDEWTLILPDLPGFGTTPEDSSREMWTMEGFAREINSIINKQEFDKLVLGGVSMGGYITMAYEKEFPNRIDGFIFSNTRDIADQDGGEARKDVVKKIIEGKRDEYIESLMEKLLADSTLTNEKETVEKTKELIQSTTDNAIIQAMRGMAIREESNTHFKTIDKPILVITGDEDKITGPDVTRPMTESYKNAELKILEGAGHLSPLEKPQDYAKTIYDFLKQIE